ncbi:MAG: UGSC family (seleno)protein [Acidimicrobiales bacterium]
MLRASAAAELAGVPTSSLVCEGFLGQAATTSVGLGMPNLPVARVPGHVDTQPSADLDRNVVEVTLPAVIDNLVSQPEPAAEIVEPSPRDVVFTGTFEEVNRLYYENLWSDGLPIVPPTIAAVESFLRFTDLDPDHSFGPLLPDNRAATVWSVAVNGVMAGCRPEYLPVLLAVVEALADPAYGVEHSGNTPGADTLITVNGPIAAELGFNMEQGVLRDGFQANTTVGRFLRLYLRNVAGFLPWQTDKATYGNTWRVAMAENEPALAAMGWEPQSVDFGFAPGDNVVTISRYTGGEVLTSVFGQHPDEMIDYLADGLTRIVGWELVFTIGVAGGTYRPLLLLPPVLAETIAAAGWSRADLKRVLWERARIPADRFEKYLGEWTNLVPGRRRLVDFVNTRKAPRVFAESADPQRLVPIVAEPEHIQLAVTGDPLRTNAYVFAHNGMLGFPTAKAVRLPADWKRQLALARNR